MDKHTEGETIKEGDSVLFRLHEDAAWLYGHVSLATSSGRFRVFTNGGKDSFLVTSDNCKKGSDKPWLEKAAQFPAESIALQEWPRGSGLWDKWFVEQVVLDDNHTWMQLKRIKKTEDGSKAVCLVDDELMGLHKELPPGVDLEEPGSDTEWNDDEWRAWKPTIADFNRYLNFDTPTRTIIVSRCCKLYGGNDYDWADELKEANPLMPIAPVPSVAGGPWWWLRNSQFISYIAKVLRSKHNANTQTATKDQSADKKEKKEGTDKEKDKEKKGRTATDTTSRAASMPSRDDAPMELLTLSLGTADEDSHTACLQAAAVPWTLEAQLWFRSALGVVRHNYSSLCHLWLCGVGLRGPQLLDVLYALNLPGNVILETLDLSCNDLSDCMEHLFASSSGILHNNVLRAVGLRCCGIKEIPEELKVFAEQRCTSQCAALGCLFDLRGNPKLGKLGLRRATNVLIVKGGQSTLKGGGAWHGICNYLSSVEVKSRNQKAKKKPPPDAPPEAGAELILDKFAYPRGTQLRRDPSNKSPMMKLLAPGELNMPGAGRFVVIPAGGQLRSDDGRMPRDGFYPILFEGLRGWVCIAGLRNADGKSMFTTPQGHYAAYFLRLVMRKDIVTRATLRTLVAENFPEGMEPCKQDRWQLAGRLR